MIKKIIFFLIVIMVLLLNCVDQKKTNNTDKSTEVISIISATQILDYSEQIQPIIANRCDKCHSSASIKYKSLTDIDRITSLKNIIENNIMPKDGPLKKENKDLILAWLDSITQ